MADSGIWQRGGLDIEQLPDPLAPHAPPPPPPSPDPPAAKPKHWGKWRIGFTAFGALFLVTILWLVFTAPLGRALEPLDNPAMLLLSSEGRPIALRGAVKEGVGAT